MPIRYEPPAPVAPGVSAAYGAAQQYSQDAGQINALRAQQLQAGIAGAGAYQAGINNATQRGDVAAHLLNQGELQRQAFLQEAQQNAWGQTHQSAMLDAQQNFEAQQQQRNQQAHQVLMQQQADLELSTAEQMRLQKYKEADSWVDGKLADGSLAPAEALEMKTQIRGMIGPLAQRETQARIKNQEATTAHLTDMVVRQKKAEMDAAKVEAMTFDERFRERPRPDALAEVMDEMGPAPTNPIAKAFYQKEALKRVAQRGGMDGFYLDPKNGWTQVKRDRAESAASKVPQFDHKEAEKAAEYEANAKYPPTLNDKGHEVLSEENRQYRFEVYNREKNKSLAAAEGSPRTHQPVTRGRFGLGQPPAAPGPGPSGPQPFDPKDVATQNLVQQSQTGKGDVAVESLSDRTDLSPDVKQAAAFNIQRIKQLNAQYGSLEAMPPEAKEQYFSSRKFLLSLPPAPEAPKPAPPAQSPPVGPQQSRGERWKNQFERGDLVTTDDIPGVPWLKRKF